MPARTKRAISEEQAELLRQIPSVDELLAQPRLAELSQRLDRNLVVEVARTVLDDLRARITGRMATNVLAEISPVACDRASLEERITALVEKDHSWATAFWHDVGYDVDGRIVRYVARPRG